ncbi:hypothetical protein F7O81_11655 [Neisseria meningitidis]|nr:hypothetical protein [Neisseria meningitidis]MBG8865629.1 hypothetical protein [Neisseria meningitidis]MBG8867738.1 hypothetical protein [Neisseria meningitidis]MBG8869848.1 hypothetical protein [Neisseria meningitidis]MBG8871973.1 hypothetical protein [Neisseria meningitidis]
MNRHSRTLRHSRESGNLERRIKETVLSDKLPCRQVWIPAYAGRTAEGGRCRLKPDKAFDAV